jgi:hypothetical protein
MQNYILDKRKEGIYRERIGQYNMYQRVSVIISKEATFCTCSSFDGRGEYSITETTGCAKEKTGETRSRLLYIQIIETKWQSMKNA